MKSTAYHRMKQHALSSSFKNSYKVHKSTRLFSSLESDSTKEHVDGSNYKRMIGNTRSSRMTSVPGTSSRFPINIKCSFTTVQQRWSPNLYFLRKKLRTDETLSKKLATFASMRPMISNHLYLKTYTSKTW